MMRRSPMNFTDKKIYVAGSNGMAGSAIVRALHTHGYKNILLRSSTELDLTRQNAVEDFFNSEKPEMVIIAAAKVGGILANDQFRADFIYNNLMIEANVIHAAFKTGVEKLIFLGSSCIYPRLASQPMKEEALLTGMLESTNEPYAIAKIAGIKLCESFYRQHNANFFSAMPTNLYGINDRFDLDTSHVIPALMNKFHSARLQGADNVVVWGSGKARREFLFVDDLAEAIVFLLENTNAKDLYENGISQINIGCGEDLTIRELAKMIGDVVEYDGLIIFDETKPDGAPQKLLDVSRINSLGWRYTTSLRDGLAKTYRWFLESGASGHTYKKRK